MFYAFTILLCALACPFLNMARGGWVNHGFLGGRLPVKSSHIICFIYAAVAYAVSWDLYVFGIVLVGTLIMWTPSWGWAIDLNNANPHVGQLWGPDDPRWEKPMVALIHKLARGNDYMSLFYRHLYILPLFAAVIAYENLSWLFLLLCPLFAACSVLGYHVGRVDYNREHDMWETPLLAGEFYAGLAWAPFAAWVLMAAK